MSNLQEKYKKEVVPKMMKQFGWKNLMRVPKVVKVVINTGVGRVKDEKQLEEVVKMLTLVAGQKPSPRSARVAISSFKTRIGQLVGYAVTLRGRRMYDFVERLIHSALPRERDFRGIDPKSFDHAGNLTLGLKEHIVFPEIIGEDYRFLFGFEVTVVTNAKKREEGIELLRMMGFPIKINH
ncbi:MAG: 50S ribosomal protein L5 [Candidatus Sungbacteria bacterium RIFCSPLOWO2_01_FULL_47_10]|uniref:Large ribosomal subunit protein uL5 n=1 Tax=Candidatus Sungbacteria bacterium RIFCSPLOWO2_01_FULL_47_10 TaxID=1802276 RepID=A0A1G2L5J5_9BACT|nr:MAG: 50S ribosomal protein L5 [Candidatus Sungbacteria bacterium RIFCSPLOWO2_01_FULL_47_10]